MAAGCSGPSDATGGCDHARNPQNPELPATEALIEKLRVRQAVLFRVRAVALRPEERQVLDELLDETSSELAGIHRVVAEARGTANRGARLPNLGTEQPATALIAPFWARRRDLAQDVALHGVDRAELQEAERRLDEAGEGQP